MKEHVIPKATLGRLPQYLQYLRRLPKCSGGTISATTIAKNLNLGEVQVRKDLAAVSGAGKPRVGYVLEDLIKNLENRLGCNRLTEAVLVGAGKLGCALLEHGGFEEYGVKIIAAFDRDERKVMIDGSEKTVYCIDTLEDFCRQHHVSLGIITAGAGSAQRICDCMVAGGIKAICNFAPCSLIVPEDVLLKHENFALSLAHLNNLLCERM